MVEGSESEGGRALRAAENGRQRKHDSLLKIERRTTFGNSARLLPRRGNKENCCRGSENLKISHFLVKYNICLLIYWRDESNDFANRTLRQRKERQWTNLFSVGSELSVKITRGTESGKESAIFVKGRKRGIEKSNVSQALTGGRDGM